MQHNGNNSSSMAMEAVHRSISSPIAQASSGGPAEDRKADMAAPAVAAEKTEQESNTAVDEGKEGEHPVTSTSSQSKADVDAALTSSTAAPAGDSKDQPSETHDQPEASSTTQAESSLPTTSVKAEHVEGASIPGPSTSSIQEGYVLVAHPDAGPSGSGTGNSNNINSGKNDSPPLADGHSQQPQAEAFLQDSQNVDEHGQEVEHYDPNTPPARIQAYARLEFPFFNFYIQKLSVTIGRRPPVSRGGSIAPKAQSGVDTLEAPEDETKEAKAGKEDAPADIEDSKGDDSAIKVKKEEEEKDVQPSTVPEQSEASNEATVKPEETPRKTSTWGDRPPSDKDADPTTPAPAPSAQPEAAHDRTSIEPGPAEESAAGGQSQQPSKSNKTQVDVDLGSIKAVSRNHARLFFDSTINPRTGLTNSWSIEVKGRNGLVLDGQWRAKGEVCRLKNGSRIQIAERIFHFVLPNGVGYPTAPPSPIMDEYYEGQPYGYPPTPDRSQSPIIYGSDSDELRSENDEFGYGYEDDDMDMDSSAHGSASGPHRGPPQLDENGQPIKRKRGRPKKQRTAEQIAAMELERQRRLDPTIPRRPRGRPPKQKKEDEGQQQNIHPPLPPIMPTQLVPIPYATQRIPAPDIPVPPLVPPDASTSSQPNHQQQQQATKPTIPIGGLDENGQPKLSKKQQAEARKAQRQAEKDERQRIKEAEKKAKEEAKAAAKEAKAAELAEKKRKDEERKKAAAEEAKRIQEEKQKAAERDKAERERQKAAAAAAAAELKAKTIADAQAKAKADAEARASKGEDSKTKGSGTGNEVKIRPAPPPQANIPVTQAQSPVKKPSQPKQQNNAPPQPQQQSQTPAVKPYIPTNQFQGKPDKPPYSYPALIAQAIWAAPNRQASLQHIHMWIPDKYPFFRDPAHAQILAQAIKQNLAVNRAFVNIPLPSGVALWAIEPDQAKLFDGNTFLPPPNAQPMPYHPPPLPQQHFYQQASPLPPQHPQQPQVQQIPMPGQQQQYLPLQPHQQQQHLSMPPQQHIPMQQQLYGTPVPMQSPSLNVPLHQGMNGMASASPAPVPSPVPTTIPSSIPPTMRHTPQPVQSPAPQQSPAPAPAVPAASAAPASSSSSSSKMPILIARPSATYSKPAPPSTSSAAANDPSSMVDNEGYPPIAIHEGRLFLSPVVFSALTAQQLSNLQSIDTKQALNILQAFVVNYFKTELKKRKKAEKAALKNVVGGIGTGGTPMSASPSPASSGMKRHATDDPMGAGNEPKIQRVS